MNKKGILPALMPIFILIGVLLFITTIGGSIFTYRISHSPWLWIILAIGVFVLFQQSRKK